MKVRLRYSKIGKVRFVGNLDVLRIWERALRKAALPVAYSTGFSPRPRLSFGLALPMAAESVAEYIDVELVSPVELDGLASRLGDALPVGFDVLAVVERLPGQVSLQEDVVACDWRIDVEPSLGIGSLDPRTAVTAALAAPVLRLERERKGERRVDDVRPAIEDLDVEAEGTIAARIATVGRGLRPSELVQVLFGSAEVVRRVVRTEQWIERDGTRRELLPLPAAAATLTGAVGA